MPAINADHPVLTLDGDPFSGHTAGLSLELFRTPQAWEEPLTMGALLKLVLLYTVDPTPGAPRDAPRRVLSPDEKFDRFAVALKLRDGGEVEVTPSEIEMLRRAIEALPTEPYGVVRTYLDTLA